MREEIKEILTWLNDKDYYIEDFGYKFKRLSLEENEELLDYITNLQEEIKRLNNIIKIMENYFELILDLGFDYDGFNDEDNLKKLIDELCRYASLGRAYNTTEVIYVNRDKKYNILGEELKGSDK